MPEFENDIILIEQLQAGNEAAYAHLYGKYRDWLVFVALTVLGSNRDMEGQDIVQEFFIDFWEKKHHLRITHPYTLRSYLHRCIYNRALNKIRDDKTEKNRKHKFYLVADHNQKPEWRAENKELRNQIESAIKKVPPLSAQVFRLTYIDDKSRSEIASEMGISPNTVKNQLVRAIKILRNHLKNV